MISAILHVVVQKFFELCRTPGVGNKLAALFIGKHSASSIAGILGALCVLAAGSVAEHLGVAVDWQLVVGVAVTVLLGGRSARPRKKRSPTPSATATTEDVDRSRSTSATGGVGDLSKRETKRVEVVGANESGQTNSTEGNKS